MIESSESVSNNVKRAIAALIMTEKSFKERMKEKDISKESASFNEARKEYNAAANLKLELVMKGMDGGKGAVTMHYSNPDKHKARQTGGIKDGSVLHKAVEEIRKARTSAFLKSDKEMLLPSEVDLTADQWCAIALALHVVPSAYKVTTEAGNRTHNKETAAAWLVDRIAEINDARQEASDKASAMMEQETFITVPEPDKKGKKVKAA